MFKIWSPASGTLWRGCGTQLGNRLRVCGQSQCLYFLIRQDNRSNYQQPHHSQAASPSMPGGLYPVTLEAKSNSLLQVRPGRCFAKVKQLTSYVFTAEETKDCRDYLSKSRTDRQQSKVQVQTSAFSLHCEIILKNKYYVV